jgi:hypothetical protein
MALVSDRGNSDAVDVLFEYLQRSDVWEQVKENSLKSYDVGGGKARCLQWIGMIGGEYAEEILLKSHNAYLYASCI